MTHEDLSVQAQYRESVLLFHVAKNGSDIRFSLFMPYIIPHTPVAHLSMGGWLLGPALSKREDTMQRSFGSRGSLFFYFTGKCGLTQVEKHIAAYILRG